MNTSDISVRIGEKCSYLRVSGLCLTPVRKRLRSSEKCVPNKNNHISESCVDHAFATLYFLSWDDVPQPKQPPENEDTCLFCLICAYVVKLPLFTIFVLSDILLLISYHRYGQ